MLEDREIYRLDSRMSTFLCYFSWNLTEARISMNPQAKENTKTELRSGSNGKLIANPTRGPESNPQQWYKKARPSGAQLLTPAQGI